MNRIATPEDLPKTDAEYEAAIGNLLTEMRRTRGQMANNQREIERLRTETQVILTQLKAA